MVSSAWRGGGGEGGTLVQLLKMGSQTSFHPPAQTTTAEINLLDSVRDSVTALSPSKKTRRGSTYWDKLDKSSSLESLSSESAGLARFGRNNAISLAVVSLGLLLFSGVISKLTLSKISPDSVSRLGR